MADAVLSTRLLLARALMCAAEQGDGRGEADTGFREFVHSNPLGLFLRTSTPRI